LLQDTYEVRHSALGTFALFLVPSGADARGAQGYVATINRLSRGDFANVMFPTRSLQSKPARNRDR
jgi:hypothetical protein